MKSSVYNHAIDIDTNHILLYNAYTDSYLILTDRLYKLFTSHIEDLETISTTNEKLYQTLAENGFLIEDDIDEKELYLKRVEERRFSKATYHIFINPTLGCNLDCWYCYEKHQQGSKMSPEMMDRVMKHIRLKYEDEPFTELNLSFFGGEPFLYFDVVKHLLQEIGAFVKDKDIRFWLHFTTNGTLFKDEHIAFLEEYHPYFQITLDGNREQHDKTRVPRNKKPTYNIIMENIQKLSWKEGIEHIQLRINFSAQSLQGLSDVIDDLKECNKKKIIIHLQRIWQVNADEIDEGAVFEFIKYAQANAVVVEYLPLGPTLSTCYADNLNQAVINYDGNVFKCTGRDFLPENAEGVLLEDGKIQWNQEKIDRRMAVQIQDVCLDCSLLPACYKVCTQNLMEKGNVGCRMGKRFSKEDYIVHNFTNKILLNR